MTNQNSHAKSRYSILSRDLSEVMTELKRRGENLKGLTGPISVWFYRDFLDAFCLCPSKATGLWIQFRSLSDFDEMHEYLREQSSESTFDISDFVSEITSLGSTDMIVANPPFESH